jgi:hypothetical protein
MKKIAFLVIAGSLVCGAGPRFAQQDKNPDQQQQAGSKNQPPASNSGQNTSTQSNPDIPKDKPGTNNPDIAPDSKPAAPTSPEHKSKNRRRKQTSSSTHTAPTS